MTSRISYNIHSQGVKDKAFLLSHLKKLQPAWVLSFVDLDFAKTLVNTLPNANVIHRDFPDEDLNQLGTPQAWLDKKRKDAGGVNLWFYTSNECGWTKELIQWHIDLIKLNAQSANPLRLVIMNQAVGTPSPDVLSMADELFRLCDQYRAWIAWGCHEYFAAVVTSGLQDTAMGHYPIQPSDWYRVLDPAKHNWHMGRFLWIVDHCKQIGVKPPRIVITECGADDLSDVESWTNTLIQTPPFTKIKFWRSCVNQWRAWYPNKAPEVVYANMLIWADQTIYRDSAVEGELIYNYGHTDPQWSASDIEGYSAFTDMLEVAALPVQPPAPVPPPVVPPSPIGTTEPQWHDAHVTLNPAITYANLRSAASTNGATLGHIQVDSFIQVDGSAPVPGVNNEGTWWHVRQLQGNSFVDGWVSSSVFTPSFLPDITPVPPQPPPSLPVQISKVTALDMVSAFDKQIAALQAQLEAVTHLRDIWKQAAA